MPNKEYPLLDSIRSVEDYKKIPEEKLGALADELRSAMIETVSENGGHLASSLGAVEIVMALHRVFTSPEDRIVFDVGHQAYAHKMLTGRWPEFRTLRKKDGVAGFPRREESEHDAFDTGHASTSISAALGYARAKQIKNEKGAAVAVIGDGALTGGLALEAMNDAGQAKVPLIVVLNDNDMSIAPNVGAMRKQLTDMRTSRGYVNFKRKLAGALDTGRVGKWLSKHMERGKNRIKNFLMPNLLFEQLGFIYIGPVNGHDRAELERVLRRARDLKGAVLIHVVTKKGKGYSFAEENPEKFHGVAPFDPATGMLKNPGGVSDSGVFGNTLVEIAAKAPDVVAVTAAMPSGTGLKAFAKAYPDRFFDVGIAEEHALTLAAGMAAGGLRPVVALYSSFLQRAYDQLYHDICLQNLPVVIGVDRAGLVGSDGSTHQGVMDVSMLMKMPNIAVYSPATTDELAAMLKMAVERNAPAVIRYPRGCLSTEPLSQPVEYGRWEVLKAPAKVTVLATGSMTAVAKKAFLAEGLGEAGLVNARFIRPFDEEVMEELGKKAETVITVEDCVCAFGDAVAARLPGKKVVRLSVPSDRIIRHASVAEQRAECGLTEEDIIRAVKEAL